MTTRPSVNALYATLPAYPTEPRLPSIRPYVGTDFSAPADVNAHRDPHGFGQAG